MCPTHAPGPRGPGDMGRLSRPLPSPGGGIWDEAHMPRPGLGNLSPGPPMGDLGRGPHGPPPYQVRGKPRKRVRRATNPNQGRDRHREEVPKTGTRGHSPKTPKKRPQIRGGENPKNGKRVYRNSGFNISRFCFM